MNSKDILKINKVIPVISIDNLDDALPLADALFEGGIRIFEITLRTSHALKAIEIVKKKFKECTIGAGTVLNSNQVKECINVGADFIITPGLNFKLLESILPCKIPIIPGIATTGELMLGLEYDLRAFKFFPAELLGGISMLKTFQSLFADVVFCPTGGINIKNCISYLELKNVMCVGGSWLNSKNLVDNKNWSEITKLAKQTSNL